jgi:hypothetical protein
VITIRFNVVTDTSARGYFKAELPAVPRVGEYIHREVDGEEDEYTVQRVSFDLDDGSVHVVLR